MKSVNNTFLGMFFLTSKSHLTRTCLTAIEIVVGAVEITP